MASAPAAGPALLLDATVWIDALQDRLPPVLATLLVSRPIDHPAIASAELAHPLGRLDRSHPETVLEAENRDLRARLAARPEQGG